MAVSVSPHCPETMPDVDHKPFQGLLSDPYVRGQCISWALRDHCLPNLIFNGSSCLTTHSSVHTSMITVSWENHPGSNTPNSFCFAGAGEMHKLSSIPIAISAERWRGVTEPLPPLSNSGNRVAHLSLEGSQACGRMLQLIMAVFCQRKKPTQRCRVSCNQTAERALQRLVSPFSLPIGLRMEPWGQTDQCP